VIAGFYCLSHQQTNRVSHSKIIVYALKPPKNCGVSLMFSAAAALFVQVGRGFRAPSIAGLLPSWRSISDDDGLAFAIDGPRPDTQEMVYSSHVATRLGMGLAAGLWPDRVQFGCLLKSKGAGSGLSRRLFHHLFYRRPLVRIPICIGRWRLTLIGLCLCELLLLFLFTL